ncbi:MAG TPA: OsmC family protein [Bryobacteraceae bacterium]|jgi:uncharacterized OsmC-like protein|nr:OsmC family protein [Bryobacteraceae bacterium]
MEVTVRHLDGVQFEVEARGHRVLCDQPRENHGADAGMTPPEFLLAALASCAGYYALEYLRTRNLPVEGLGVRVTAEKAKQPTRLGSFRVEVTTPALDQRHQDGVLRAVNSCLVHHTLLHTPSIEIVVHTPVETTA